MKKKMNYDASVKKMRDTVKQWKRISVDMLRELDLMRGLLTSQKGQYRDPDAPNYLPLSWTGYCGEIGLPYKSVDRWLREFKPFELTGNEPPKMDKRKTGKKEGK